MSSSKKIEKYKKKQILVMKDSSDSRVKKKPLIFDVPFRLAIVGGSGSGKTSLLSLLLIDPKKEFYNNLWLGENVYIFSGSYKTDFKVKKIVEVLAVPDSNIFTEYDDDILNLLYEQIEERIQQKDYAHSLFIFDDLSYSSEIRSKRNNALGRLYQNGRKNLVSSIFISQKYSSILPAVRVNLSGLILYQVPQSELEQVAKDHNFLKKNRDFYSLFRSNVKERHEAMIINYSNKFSELYLDNNFVPIDTTEYNK